MNRVGALGAAACGAAVLVAVALGALYAARAQTAAPGRFAPAMPRGALVYVEARDLGGLLSRWLASPVRERYFASASYRSFTRSRLYLKLRERLKSFEAGFGVAVDDAQLAALAGGPSAVAVYDPGRLEVLLVTEVPSERALASPLFAAAASFERRQTAKGAPYYSRDVAAGEGEPPQRIAFGYAGDRLWVGTNEALVAEAIDGPSGGGLGEDVSATVRAAGDVEASDLVVWFDLERSLRNKYFDLYWIHRNARELEGIASGLLDLRFAPEGVVERRWYVRRDAAAAAGDGAAPLERLRAAAPPDAQLVEAKAADAAVSAAVAETVFGPERPPAALAAIAPSSSEDPFGGEEEGRSSAPRRYASLDARFDRDVDDPASAGAVRVAAAEAPPAFGERLAALVAPAAPRHYAVYGAVALGEGQLFARFDRTVVVELGAPERFDRAAFEALVAEEFTARFVVGGDAKRVAWSDDGGARAVAGALLSQGGAYRIEGRYLVVARDAASCAAVAARLAAPPPDGAGAAEMPRGAPVRVAEVRVAAAAGPFKRLTAVLDARQRTTLNEEIAGEGEGTRPVLFFSENVASLLDTVRELDRVRIATASDGAVLRERVEYLWGPAGERNRAR